MTRDRAWRVLVVVIALLQAGQEYLVAAGNVVHENVEGTSCELEGVSLCGGTRLLSAAQEDLAELGSGKKPK